MKYLVFVLFLAMAVCLSRGSSALAASVIHVPADYPTIQAGIDAASNGDTVLVAPGTYMELIDFHGKAIVVTSEAGPAMTIIDAGQAGTVVTFATAEGADSVLNGFTVQNGLNVGGLPGLGSGGGIRINHSGPTIVSNWILHNFACDGSGISSRFGSPIIRGNKVSSNGAACSGGGGISAFGSGDVQILDNEVSNNLSGGDIAAGIAVFGSGTATISGNLITRNRTGPLGPCSNGGGIALQRSGDVSVAQNVITNNVAGCGGGIFWLDTGSPDNRLIVNNTIADNDAASGSGIFAGGFQSKTLVVNNVVSAAPGQTAIACGDDFYDFGDPPAFRNNDVFSDTLRYSGFCVDQTGTNGNIGDDPEFVNAAGGDYHLTAASPAIDGGDTQAPNLPAADFDGNPRVVDGDGNGSADVDIGAYEFQHIANLAVGGSVELVSTAGRSGLSLPLVPLAVGGLGLFATVLWTRRAKRRS